MTIATRETTGHELAARIEYARALAVSNLLPAAYRGKPENVLLAIEYGSALAIPPIQAINGIHVIDGKPTASADLIAALVRRAGHKLRVVESAGPSVTASLIRHDDPDFAYSVTWDMDKARAAGLTGKGVWKSYPGQMLRARAITEVCRQGASDALYGVIYTAEELGHDEAQQGDLLPADEPTLARPAIAQTTSIADALDSLNEADLEVTPMAIRDQQTALATELARHSIKGKAAILAWCSQQLDGRALESGDDLTADEADRLITLAAEAPVGEWDA